VNNPETINPPAPRRGPARGFSLIELLVTVAILAILAAVAVPSYQAYVNQARRADAKAALTQAAQFMERSYTTNGCYNKTTPANCAGQAGADIAVPASGTPYYTLAFAAGSPTRGAFTLQAVRAGAMTGDACGDYTLDNTGAQGLANNTLAVADCWPR
jgi:type IV pilus assembly protein PilE